jgi:hypothetical protein
LASIKGVAMRSRKGIVLLVLVACVLGYASSAQALTPGRWTRVTDSNGSILGEVGLARTPDGVLHLAWSRATPADPSATQDLLDDTISARGIVGSPRVIAAAWPTIENPALVAIGGPGLDLFTGAIRSLNPGETISNLAFFNSADGGATWGAPSEVTNTGAAYSSDVTAALGTDGTAFEAWGSSSCLCVHSGTLSTTANVDFQAGLGDFGYEPGMAIDSGNHHLIVAWYSNGTGHTGVYAATVDQTTGERSGSPLRMPGTKTISNGPLGGRTQVVARHGGGVYVAYEGGYPTQNKVLLWRVGAPSATTIAHSSSGVRSVGLAATPTGRLWVLWSTTSASGKPVVHARRSNTAVTGWGATVTIKPPKGASTSWNLQGDGQSDRLDLLGSFTIGTSSHAASWYTQLLPGLTLQAAPSRLSKGTRHPLHVRFTVSDAGRPVAGARVSVGSIHGVTSSSGQVTLALGPFQHRGHVTAKATDSAYSGAQLTLKIR